MSQPRDPDASEPLLESKDVAGRIAWSDAAFLITLALLGSVYVLLIVAALLADVSYVRLPDVVRVLSSEEIRYATRLSIISSCVTTILSLWVAIPIGYLLSRYSFPGKVLLDAILDIPIVLPPLVVGVS